MASFALIQGLAQASAEWTELRRLIDSKGLSKQGPIYLMQNAKSFANTAARIRSDDALILPPSCCDTRPRNKVITRLNAADLDLLPADLREPMEKALLDFYSVIDEILADLRLSNDIDEKKIRRLKEICAEPSFDPLKQIPGLYHSPLNLVTRLAYEDPKIVENSRYLPTVLDRRANEYIKRYKQLYRSLEGLKPRAPVNISELEETFPDFKAPWVEAASAKEHAAGRTELALTILDIFKSNGFSFALADGFTQTFAPQGHDGYALDAADNYQIASYLIDNGANQKIDFAGKVVANAGKKLAKFNFLISKLRYHSMYDDSEKVFAKYRTEVLDLFSVAVNNNEKLDDLFGEGHDAVSVLLHWSQNIIPEKLVLDLLEQANSMGYNFADFHRVDNQMNLLQIAMGEVAADYPVLRFLVEHGVDPFHEYTEPRFGGPCCKPGIESAMINPNLWDFTAISDSIVTGSPTEEAEKLEEACVAFEKEANTAFEMALEGLADAFECGHDLHTETVQYWTNVLALFQKFKQQP